MQFICEFVGVAPEICKRLDPATSEKLRQQHSIRLSKEKVEKCLMHGRTEDLSEIRENGGFCHRKELDNQPLVDGYLSPMWNGTIRDENGEEIGVLRYETQEIYDQLSR